MSTAGFRLAFAFCVVAAACSDTPAPNGWRTTLDTTANGAVHVVNIPPASDAEPDWSLDEKLRIGSVDGAGPASFGELKGLAVLQDGRIAVLDAQAQEIRIFAATGAHVATWGGEGGG